MTPEDTPRMAERTDRQAQIDPWDSVHEEFADMSQWETARVYRADAVDAARAADAALLRERDAQIAHISAQVKHANECEAAHALADHERIEALRAERDALKAQVAQHEEAFAIEREDATQWRIECGKAEAERDAAQQQIATLTAYKAAFEELYATVQGECPSLLDPCRGGSDVLWNLCAAALQSTRPQEQPPEPAEPSKPSEPRKPVINLMEALKKSLDSLNANRTSQEP